MRPLSLLLALAALGCTDPVAPPPPDAGPSLDATAPELDAGPPPPAPACTPGPREVRAVAEATAIEPDDTWLFAFAGDDPYFRDFITGTMSRPAPGEDALGTVWEELPLVEPHRLGRVRDGALYAIANLRVEAGQRVLARAGRLMGVSTRGGLAPETRTRRGGRGCPSSSSRGTTTSSCA